MKNLLFHIGFHKTASTWFQNEFFLKHTSTFNALDIKEKHYHSWIAMDFIFDEEQNMLNPNDINKNAILEKIDKIGTTEDDRINVITHERLSGNPHSGGFDSSIIADRIHKIFPNAKIFMVIREQNSWLLSNYYQYLTAGGTKSLVKYLNTKYDAKIPYFSPNHIKYHFLINKYYDLFGKDNVLVFPYELFVKDKPIFCETFGKFVNKEITINQNSSNKKYNKKVGFYVNYKTRWLNIFYSSSSVNHYSPYHTKVLSLAVKGLRRMLIKLFPKSVDENLIKSQKKIISDWSRGIYESSNNETSKLIGIDLEKFGYSITK